MAGNPAQDTDTAVKDTVAVIDVLFDGDKRLDFVVSVKRAGILFLKRKPGKTPAWSEHTIPMPANTTANMIRRVTPGPPLSKMNRFRVHPPSLAR